MNKHGLLNKPPHRSAPLSLKPLTIVAAVALLATSLSAPAEDTLKGEPVAGQPSVEGNTTIAILASANYPAPKLEAWKGAGAGEIIPLTDADVTAYVQTIKDLSVVAEAVQSGMAETMGVATALTIAEGSEAGVVLKTNRMTDTRLRNIGYSLAAATAALDIGEERMNAAVAANAALLRQLQVAAPPGPYQSIRAEARNAYEMLAAWQNQPPQNVELAKRYRAELEAVHDVQVTEGAATARTEVEAETFVETD